MTNTGLDEAVIHLVGRIEEAFSALGEEGVDGFANPDDHDRMVKQLVVTLTRPTTDEEILARADPGLVSRVEQLVELCAEDGRDLTVLDFLDNLAVAGVTVVDDWIGVSSATYFSVIKELADEDRADSEKAAAE